MHRLVTAKVKKLRDNSYIYFRLPKMIIKPISKNLTFASSVQGNVKESNYFMLKSKKFTDLDKFDVGYFATLSGDDDKELYDSGKI